MSNPPLPPGSILYQLSIGHYVSRALHVAASWSATPSFAAGPRPAAAIAAAIGTDAAALRRVLRLLVSVGVFTEEDDASFGLTPLGEALRSDAPGSARALVLLFSGIAIQDSWKELEYCVRTGQPAFRKHSPDGDAFTNFDPEQAAIFDAAMATFAPQSAAAMAAAYDFSRFERVVDVGGGNGAILIGLLGANPRLRGTVFDRPQVEAGARRKIAEAGLTARCEFVAGDFIESVPAGADAYVIKHVIHDWDDEQATTILRNIRRAMKPGARLLLAEGVYPHRIDASRPSRGAAANDVNMLVVTGGRQRSEEEFRALYDAAGFALEKIIPTASPLCLVEGVPR
jgi:SAM-dependent methyltransferase